MPVESPRRAHVCLTRLVLLLLVTVGSTDAAAERLPVSPALLSRQWPASWIAMPGAPERDAGVYHFRRRIALPQPPARLLIHVSADQRYVLHVNGTRVGAGPGRGDPEHWPFETYDIGPLLRRGENLVAALQAQMRSAQAPPATPVH